MAKEKDEMFVPQEETLQAVRAAFPWLRIEDCRTDMIRFGSEFAHPEYASTMLMDIMAMQAGNVDPSKTREQLREEREAMQAPVRAQFDQIREEHPEFEEFGTWKEYQIDGCPEEPNAPKLDVLVRHLHEGCGKPGPYPTVLIPPTGGTYLNEPKGSCSAPVSKYLGVQIVTPRIRCYPDEPYPAAINDLHATYQWMIDNAEELNIDTDRILLTGVSSGAMLSAALPFRLKRYGWCGGHKPRGVVLYNGFYDDRETRRSERLIDRAWSGVENRCANMLYMGSNFASGFVGPEAFANHATVEECRGLPPYAFIEHQDDTGNDSAVEFMQKLNDAGVFVNFMSVGGCTHSGQMPDSMGRVYLFNTSADPIEPKPGFDILSREESFLIGSFRDFLDYDLRRD